MTPEQIILILQGELQRRANEQTSPAWRGEDGRIYVRASSSGKCSRALWYWLNGEKALPMSVESEHAFEHGQQAHKFVRDLLKQHFPEDKQEMEVIVDLDNIVLVGHIDDLIDDAVIEVKSAKQYGFDKMKDGDIGDEYLSQDHVYMIGTGKRKVIQVLDNKPTRTIPAIVSHLGYVQDDASRVMAAFEVRFDDMYWLNLQAQLQTITGTLPPDPLPEDPEDRKKNKELAQDAEKIAPWQCLYCEFAHVCRIQEGYELVSKSKGKYEKGFRDGWSLALARF